MSSRSGRTALVVVSFAVAPACSAPQAAHAPPWPTEIREYVLPDTLAFPNDVAVGEDGVVWYSDRLGSHIGRLDPETGDVRQYPTPTPASAPYGVSVAEDGSVWYAGSRAGVVGRLDPRSGVITEYPVGEGGPHAVVAVGGRVWFTMRRSGGYGWLNPVTGETRVFEFEMPTGYAAQDRGPYALVAGQRGELWFTAMGNSALYRVDTRDGSLRRLNLGTRGWPRRLAVDGGGAVWFSNFPMGKLGRLVPGTGVVEEIPLVRRPSEPYGIAVDPHGRVWVNEARNGRVMGYDPVTDEFRPLTIPTPGATVRGMAVDARRGRIWLPLSGTNRIGVIEVGEPRRFGR